MIEVYKEQWYYFIQYGNSTRAEVIFSYAVLERKLLVANLLNLLSMTRNTSDFLYINGVIV